jgi:prolyl oligopeptidase
MSLAAAVAALAACAEAQLGPQPFPGQGPAGKPMTLSTEQAVGMNPNPAFPPIYPLTVALGATASANQAEEPYRWLESLDTAAVKQWIEAQTRLSRPRLAALSARPWIKGRLSELASRERYGLPVKAGGRYFFVHQDANRGRGALYVSERLDGPGRALFDPATLPGGKLVLDGFAPAPGGEVVAYALSEGGSSAKEWRFRRVGEDRDLPDRLRAQQGSVSWARDGSGVYYSRYAALADGKAEELGVPSIYFHRLGGREEKDTLVYAAADQLVRALATRVTDDGHYLVITLLLEGDERNAVELLDLRRAGAKPLALFGSFDARYSFMGASSEWLYFLSTRSAPAGRVIAVSAREPGSAAVTVVPESAAPLEAASFAADRIVACYIENAHSVVRLYSSEGRPEGEPALPGLGHAEGFAAEGQQSQTFFLYSDYLTPPEVWQLDLASGRTQLWRRPDLHASTDRYLTEQLFFLSKDGTRLPMYVTHRRDMPHDGNQPLLLEGYAGNLAPRFSTQVLTWLEMGGAYAAAGLRSLDSRQNVDDFIAAADYLVRERYTRSRRLGIYGRGDAAALIGAVMTQRPELFGAVLPSPAMRSSATAPLAALDAYSPYRRVRQGICYPPTLVTTADRDSRIPPWHSYKLVAALQAVQLCSNPILLAVTASGPGSAAAELEQISDQWAFLAQWLGMGDIGSG